MLRPRPRIDRVLPRKTARSEGNAALNLAELDPPVWHIMSRDKAHGPFTLGQIQSFADSGKIGPMTRISSGDGEPFVTALDQPALRARVEAVFASRATRRAEASNFVIISGPDAGAGTQRRFALGAALNQLGRFAEPMPGSFILRSNHPITDVRRALTAAAPEGTQLVIFESRDARLGWSGLSAQGAEALRAVWDAALPSTD